MDHYSTNFAGEKAGPLINNDEIKAKFPDEKYIQDITVRSYLCHALETSKDVFDKAISEDENLKKEAIKDLTLNLAVVQLKKIYKINSLKFAKILSKEKEGITSAEVKETKAELARQIKLDVSDIFPDNVKGLIVAKNQKVTNQDVVNIAKEIKKIDVVIDEIAISNVNKYLVAITDTFEILRKIKGINVKNLQKSQKILENIICQYMPQKTKHMMNAMIDLVAKRNIADRFHFTGFLKGKQVHEMLAESDVYIMPSVSEPFGISPLEAMQVGTPSIISKQSGCAEILTHAIKTDYWDIDAMADAIYAIVKNPAMHKSLQELGRDEVNNIRWQDAGLKVRGIYESVM
jgi:hypothetical protein